MADQYNDKTYVRETRTEPSSGGSMALILGGLVVAVGFILWLVFGGDGPSTVVTDPAADTSNVTVEPAAPADSTTNVIVEGDEPAADPVFPVDPAPADTGAAPADGTDAPASPPANP